MRGGSRCRGECMDRVGVWLCGVGVREGAWGGGGGGGEQEWECRERQVIWHDCTQSLSTRMGLPLLTPHLPTTQTLTIHQLEAYHHILSGIPHIQGQYNIQCVCVWRGVRTEVFVYIVEIKSPKVPPKSKIRV